MKKMLLIDRDGTIIVEPENTRQVNGLDQVEFLPFTISTLKKFADSGFEIVVVSNQDGLGTDSNPKENYDLINKKITQVLASEGVKISHWLTCPHIPSDCCECRKPKIGMVTEILSEIDKTTSVMIGDRETDLEFAKNVGIRGFKIDKETVRIFFSP